MPLISARVQRWPRPWRMTLITVIALYLLYLVAGNVFLNTPLFDAVTDRKPHKFTLDTGPMLTLVPGHVFAWNVRVRGQANRTVYVITAERARAWISLPALFKREIRIPMVDAGEVRANVQRVDQAIPPPPRGDRGWTLRMDAIHSDSIRSGQFGKLLITGNGSGTVGFLKQMRGGPSELFDSQARFEQATVSIDGLTLLDDAHLAARASFPRHYRDDAPGLAKLGILKARLEVAARSQGLYIDTAGAHMKVGTVPSTARLDADLTMEGGALQPGSRLVWRLPVHAGVGATDRGLLALQLDVAQDMRVQARLPRDEETGSELQADLRVSGRRIPFQAMPELLPRVSGELRGAWRFRSLNWIADMFVRKPWFHLDGGGLLKADLKIADGQLAPGSSLDIPQVDAVAEVAGVSMRGNARAQGRIVDGAPPQAQLQVQIPRFRATPSGSPKVLLFDGRDMALTLHGDARLQQLRDGVRARLRFTDARVPDLASYNRYLGNDQLRLIGGSGLLTGDMELDSAGRLGQGRVDLRGQGAQLQLAGTVMRGDARVQARVRRADFESRQFDLGGTTLSLRNVQVGADQAGADGRWWGEASIRSGHIDAAAPFQADGLADLRLRDAAPLLGLFAQRSEYPRWVLGLLDSGEVQASGQLRWRKGRLQIEDLAADNERLSLRARLDLQHAQKRGDLYVRWGVLGAGIELAGQKRQWHLAGARDWYSKQPRLLPRRSGTEQSASEQP